MGPLISGKSRLVKYCSIWPDGWIGALDANDEKPIKTLIWDEDEIYIYLRIDGWLVFMVNVAG